jgi:hypothetical protein
MDAMQNDKMAIILFSGTVDKLLAASILASGGADRGGGDWHAIRRRTLQRARDVLHRDGQGAGDDDQLRLRPPAPPHPSRIHHYEKIVFNRAYWHIVPTGIV